MQRSTHSRSSHQAAARTPRSRPTQRRAAPHRANNDSGCRLSKGWAARGIARLLGASTLRESGRAASRAGRPHVSRSKRDQPSIQARQRVQVLGSKVPRVCGGQVRPMRDPRPDRPNVRVAPRLLPRVIPRCTRASKRARARAATEQGPRPARTKAQHPGVKKMGSRWASPQNSVAPDLGHVAPEQHRSRGRHRSALRPGRSFEQLGPHHGTR